MSDLYVTMTRPDSIDIRVGAGPRDTGNVAPLLNEVRHALVQLLDTGKETIIDLRSIPLGPGESERLEETLGEGEIEAVLHSLGRSTIRETAYPGVWLVTHYNEEDEIMGKFVEVTHIPQILKSQNEDINEGLQRLGSTLEQTH